MAVSVFNCIEKTQNFSYVVVLFQVQKDGLHQRRVSRISALCQRTALSMLLQTSSSEYIKNRNSINAFHIVVACTFVEF